MPKVIYLASPYSHPDADVRKYRYEQARDATIWLINKGYRVFSPIVYSHQLALAGLASDWQFWSAFDLAMIDRCDVLWILDIDGRQQSIGVEKEREYAMNKMPIRYVMSNGWYHRPEYQFKEYNPDGAFDVVDIPTA